MMHSGVIPDTRARVLARPTAWLFATTTFTASALVFLVQPMFAKMVLPRLGGSPAVWNTCVLFFQATLLLGYSYAHLSTKWLGARRPAQVHLVLMGSALAFLPLTRLRRSSRPIPTWKRTTSAKRERHASPHIALE